MGKISPRTIEKLKSTSRAEMEEAFNLIYGEYFKPVFYIALKILRDASAADDVTNETFMKFYTHKEGINKDKNIKYYLLVTAKNLSLNYIEAHRRFEQLDENTEYIDKASERDDFAEYLGRMGGFLDGDEIDMLVLHLVCGYKFREIAHERGVSVNVISSKYKRILDKIKEHFKDEKQE